MQHEPHQNTGDEPNYSRSVNNLDNIHCVYMDRRVHNRMVVEFTTTCAISAYHQ